MWYFSNYHSSSQSFQIKEGEGEEGGGGGGGGGGGKELFN